MKSKNKLIYVGFAFKHHKLTHAGYHHIKDYIKYDIIIDSQWEFDFLNYQTSSLFIRGIRRIYRILLGDGCPITVIRCILLSLLNRNLVFHFIYAENTYKWLHKFKGKSNKIICTYHQPVDFFISNSRMRSDLKNIDKVILMTQKGIDQFREWTEKENVYFIPHGIDTHFYSPDFNVNKKKNILMVGNWLRDFQFANEVFRVLLINNTDLTINIVINEENKSFFKYNEKLFLQNNISDEQLRDLYISTKCLFLPLKSFTANNSILEAAATGCPIVIATDNIDTSYLNLDQIDFLPLQVDTVCKHLTFIINNEIDKKKIKNLHNYIVDRYSWEVISSKTREILYDSENEKI